MFRKSGIVSGIIDYGISDIAAKHMVLATHPVYDVPCRPHIGVVHWINQKPRYIKTCQLVKPRKIPFIADLDDPARLEPYTMQKALGLAREWTDLPGQIHKIDQQLWGYVAGLDDSRASWELGVEYATLSMAQEIRRASTSTHDPKKLREVTGRGQVPHFRWSRLIPKKPPEYMQFSDTFISTGDLDPIDTQEKLKLFNARIGVRGESWEMMVYGNNLTDEIFAFGHYDTPLLAGGHHIYQGPTKLVGARFTYDF